MWSLSLITAPAAEPLERATEVHQHLRLDSDLSAQEPLLDALISATRRNCETFTSRQLITATWELWMDSWCEPGIYRDDALFLPLPPLQSVTSVKYLDTGGVLQTWPADQYIVDAPAGPAAQRARIVPAYGVSWPTLREQPQAVKVRFVAGYGAEAGDVPAGLRAGMLLEVAEMYERRELVTLGTISSPNFLSAERLWWPFRAF